MPPDLIRGKAGGSGLGLDAEHGSGRVVSSERPRGGLNGAKMDESQVTAQDKINILLTEYSTLRDELLQRNTILNQTFGIAAIFATAALSLLATSLFEVGIIMIVNLPLPLAFFTLMLRFDTDAAANRVREIEARINEIAGSRLLVWETDNGLYKVAYLDRVRSVLSGKWDVLSETSSDLRKPRRSEE